VLYWREIENYYRSIQDLTKVLELDPTWSLAYLNRGLAHKLRNEPEKAISDFRRYLEEGTEQFWIDAAQRQLAELGASSSSDQASGLYVGSPTPDDSDLSGSEGGSS
jgi:lipoprotein NlpI